MDKLDIRIVKSERDFEKLYELEEAAYQNHNREDNRYFGIGSIGAVPVGCWSGLLRDHEKKFISTYVFVLSDFRGELYGNDLREHQLKFAKSLGCKKMKSMVLGDNLESLAIQKKFGGKLVGSGVYMKCFEFDLEKLNL